MTSVNTRVRRVERPGRVLEDSGSMLSAVHAPEGRSTASEAPEQQLAAGLFASGKTAYVLFWKPLLDVACASAMLVVLSPLLLVIWLTLRTTLGKGTIYRQMRVGRGGKPFVVLKFRTMRADRRQQPHRVIAEDRRTSHKSAADPRHTRVGRLLRASSLDELPQLLNVVRGEMSLVGPRPELVHIVDAYPFEWQHARHVVKPGLTGMWQITARGDVAMHDAVHLDLTYARQMSMMQDLRIMLATPAALLKRPGR